MNDSELVRKLKELHDNTGRLLAAFEVPDSRDGMTVLQRIREGYNGWPASSSFEGPTARAATDRDGEPIPGHADPTGDAAGRPDRARDDRLRIDRGIEAATRAITPVMDTVTHHVLRAANVIERASTKKAEPGCVSCARVSGHHGGSRWEPVYRVGYCRWCWEWKRATGVLPSKEDLIAHHDGKKIKRPA